MNDKLITAEACDSAFTTIATWRSLEEYNSACNNIAEATRFSAYCAAGVVMLGDLLGESYAAVEKAVSARYDKIYGDQESAIHE